MRLRHRLGDWLTRRRDRERDLDRELRAHVDLEAEDLEDAGMSPDAARRAAGHVLGNVTAIKEDVREVWGWPAIERFVLDVRYSLRLLRRTPAFTIGAALSLSLAIGVNVAVFTLIDAVLLNPLPVSDPASLVRLSFYSRDGRGPDYVFSYPDFRALGDATTSLSGLIAASSVTRIDVGRGADATQAYAKIVSANYFSVLGVRPAVGRVLEAADEHLQSAVIADSYWRRVFNRSPSAIGSEIVLGGLPFTIVGVAPPAFFGDTIGESPDLWTSVALQTPERRTQRYVTWARLLGRLAPGVAIDAARGELGPLAGRVGFEGQIDVEPGADGVPGLGQRLSIPLRALMVFVLIVWLIACTNLASLLLTRASARQREIATRLAIGASRLRVARQLAIESVLIALAGGAVGLLISTWASRFILNLAAAVNRTPVVLDLTPNARVLLFALGIAVITGLLVGVGPAVHAVRRDVSPSLRSGRSIVGRERRWGLGEAAIVAQVALSLLLLAVSGLFLGTLGNLRAQETGFSGADHVLLIEVRPQRGYRPDLSVLIPRLQEGVAAIPGVTNVSMAFGGTLFNQGGVMGLQVEGYTPAGPDDQRARADWVAPGYFATSGIPVVTGRAFAMTDTASAPRVVMVNETMARFYFGDRPATGRRLRFNNTEYEIIGIARDAKYDSLRSPTPRMLYFTLLQNPSSMNSIEVRTAGSPTTVAAAVRDTIRAIDPQLSVGGMMTLEDRVRRSLGPEYFLANLSGLLSTLTLLLAAVGVYGTLAYASARRRNEIGVRLALGASRVSVIWTMLRDLVWLLSAGMLLGAGAVFFAGRLVRSLLFGLSPTDPVTIGLAALLLIAIALAAGYAPARRASRLDLAEVLRMG